LKFLFSFRKAGCLYADDGPAVIVFCPLFRRYRAIAIGLLVFSFFSDL
jgi:hypothetical protein